MTKPVRIGLIVAVILLILVALYYFFKKAKKKGTGPYVNDIPAADYNAFYSALAANICPNPDGYDGRQYTCEELSRGYLKTNNLAMTAANVALLKTEILAYVNAPGSKPHWLIN